MLIIDSQRYSFNGTQILSDILPNNSVAARGSYCKNSFPIEKFDAEAEIAALAAALQLG